MGTNEIEKKQQLKECFCLPTLVKQHSIPFSTIASDTL